MEAGVDTVVGTLWKVDDAATRGLIGAFYEILWKHELGASEALRRARLSPLRSEEFKAPRYWGAFVLSGEWR